MKAILAILEKFYNFYRDFHFITFYLNTCDKISIFFFKVSIIAPYIVNFFLYGERIANIGFAKIIGPKGLDEFPNPKPVTAQKLIPDPTGGLGMVLDPSGIRTLTLRDVCKLIYESNPQVGDVIKFAISSERYSIRPKKSMWGRFEKETYTEYHLFVLDREGTPILITPIDEAFVKFYYGKTAFHTEDWIDPVTSDLLTVGAQNAQSNWEFIMDMQVMSIGKAPDGNIITMLIPKAIKILCHTPMLLGA